MACRCCLLESGKELKDRHRYSVPRHKQILLSGIRKGIESLRFTSREESAPPAQLESGKELKDVVLQVIQM